MTKYKVGKKLNGDTLSIRDLKMVQGFLGEVQQLFGKNGEPVYSKAYGNELYTVILTDLNTNEEKTYWADAGLRGTLSMSKAKPGVAVQINHTGEKDIEYTDKETGKTGKATVQTYDLMELVAE